MIPHAEENLASLNYQIMLQAREMFRVSPAETALRFHFTVEQGKSLISASHEDLKAMASGGRLKFNLDFAVLSNVKPN